MPLVGQDPVQRATLAVIYQFGVPISPRVAARNFTISEAEAAKTLQQLELEELVREVSDGVYVLTDAGERAARQSLTFRGVKMRSKA